MVAPQPLHALIISCLEGGDARSWQELIGRVQPIFARAAYRVAVQWCAASREEIDDIVQESCLKLGSFANDTILRANLESEEAAARYLMVMAANTARDYLRSKYAEKRGESRLISATSMIEAIVPGAEPGADRKILLSQIDGLLNAGDRERTIFWLYYKQGFTAKEIAGIAGFGLSVKGVESLIHRLTDSVRRKFCSQSIKGKPPLEAS